MDLPDKVTKAQLLPLPDGEPIWVHFNPATLVYSLENSTRQQGGDPKRRQYAGTFSGKLTMDLQFDTTGTGEDVRKVTNKVAFFMESTAKAKKRASVKGTNLPAQPVLAFQWGTYVFKGIMESFKETIDFFSADGVPLRALVSIGLARQDNVFDEGQGLDGTNTGAGKKFETSVVKTSKSDSARSAATKGGDPKAARALASANGLENPRFTGGASLEVSAGIQLNAAARFAASASLGGGSGISGDLGAAAGAAGPVQVSLAVGGGALFGSKASAGVAASAGAFAGLETGRAAVSTTAQLDPLEMLPATVGSDVSVGENASFSLGGAATAQSGFSTDVGANFSFNQRLVFDSD
jgi:Contractile injection system tube protein